ncbi:MAG: hypothetical protein C3F02_01240 [Parcubacteria group bacterium]|nr:MAG: hypothetical protein C3F02_01240 [Parcubacteria group bacterium]
MNNNFENPLKETLPSDRGVSDLERSAYAHKMAEKEVGPSPLTPADAAEYEKRRDASYWKHYYNYAPDQLDDDIELKDDKNS